jgi:uncharacterized membrane protein (DUF485 family)
VAGQSLFSESPQACGGIHATLQAILKRMETPMTDPVAERIQSHPKYLELKRERNRFGWLLTALMLFVYYGYIALIAFNKPFLAQPIGNGVTTLGVPLGFGVIVFTIVITGIYVRRANGRYDALTQAILKDAAR